ncbi:hypothetical protein ISN44_As12g034690 [Arabidopsis suecica]|uniref:Uncharacterized protein n=1 Tax=Arabidopsis suecica TaxID=45249 RepID=A0A8T1YPU5_ARASU|nr:hypothetical protein ISN44_As12g034690 [Arabidopsis suecica]
MAASFAYLRDIKPYKTIWRLQVSAESYGRRSLARNGLPRPNRYVSPPEDTRTERGRSGALIPGSRNGGSHSLHRNSQSNSYRFPSSRDAKLLRASSSFSRPSHHHKSSYHRSKELSDKNQGKAIDDGRKRRYEDFFYLEKSFEPSNKGRMGYPRRETASFHRTRVENRQVQASPHLSNSQLTISEPLLFPLKAKQGNLSPALVREHPFRLNLSKKLISSDKRKGKVMGSHHHTLGDSQPLVPLGNLSLGIQSEKKKSWYEITLEEDAENEDDENEEVDPDTTMGARFSKKDEAAFHALEPPLAEIDALDDDDLLGKNSKIFFRLFKILNATILLDREMKNLCLGSLAARS